MTTPAAERLYLAQHLVNMEGRNWAVFNPHSKPLTELPAIYEIRFIKGRLKFGDATNSAPFPSMLVIFQAAPPVSNPVPHPEHAKREE